MSIYSMKSLNYYFINLLIVFAFYGLLTEKIVYKNQLLIILLSLTLLYNIVNDRESFLDFSEIETSRASLDIFTRPPPSSDNLRDKCGRCNNVCLVNDIGRRIPPAAYPLCQPHGLIKNASGAHLIQSIRHPGGYFSYDLQEGAFYLAKPTKGEIGLPDLQWNIEKHGENFRLSTLNTPRLYLYANKRGQLELSYIPFGEWIILQGSGGGGGSQVNPGILIKSAGYPSLYLTSDGRNVSLNNFLDYWQLIRPATHQQESFENPSSSSSSSLNLLQFPDSGGGGGIGEWSKYYSAFWNGEYIYKNTTPTNKDYLTVHILPDGTGTISTKKETWHVLSISPQLLYGDNANSYIYLEMLTAEKGGKFYDPNRPQIKILTKDKNALRPQYTTLVDAHNPNNLNAYSYKVGDVGENVKAYPMEESYTNMPINFLMNGLRYLGAGYNLPTINLSNVKKPCVLAIPTTAPVNTGVWALIDQTGKLKSKTFGPMDVAYSYLYKCVDGTTEESPRSPPLHLPTSVGGGGVYYGAAVNVTGNKAAQSIRIYVKGDGDKDFQMMQEVGASGTTVEVAVIPNAVKKALAS